MPPDAVRSCSCGATMRDDPRYGSQILTCPGCGAIDITVPIDEFDFGDSRHDEPACLDCLLPLEASAGPPTEQWSCPGCGDVRPSGSPGSAQG